MSEPFLNISEVSKTYDTYRAVDRVSLKIPKGKIYGLLGPNGAGKTSIIRMITGITAPDEGKIFFNGQLLDPSHARFTGYMPEERGLYKKMKVKEQLVYLLSLKGMHPKEAASAADTWLQRLGLADWANHKTTDLSKGMQQKVQFIVTVAHTPQLLILDEPFSGLDPINARLIEQEILLLKDQGTTIIFSTHRLEQVEELCDYIALINKGKVLIENDIRTVRKQFQKDLYKIVFTGDSAWWATLDVGTVNEITEKHVMIQLNPGFSGNDLMGRLANSPLAILSFELHLPRLTDIFIELVSNA
ncbi:MAG: ATP-binding cassette domain-containing protein [Bacteroidia bacterium]|nr:ATP-binding cassette domain-containing protein [Bacteroidia bacterium]